MKPMHLVDPQPMNTLPDDGEVYIDTMNVYTGKREIAKYHVALIRLFIGCSTEDSWSHSAVEIGGTP